MAPDIVFAQTKVIGFVKDIDGKPLTSVNVNLISNGDSIKSITNQFGKYEFESIDFAKFKLMFSMLGKTSESLSIDNNERKLTILIPNVTLQNFAVNIQDVNVTKIIPVIVNGDTTQINFGAFDFRKNSLLEEGLKKLPGFQVGRDGSVFYNGQSIRKVKVDNKDFFGGDLLTATKNLPVEIIKNIQIIEFSTDKEQQTGVVSDLDKEKILNITLKEDKKRIYFGQFTTGAGTNDRYLGSFGLNRFDDGREISLLGSFNNTNSNLFSYGNPIAGDRGKNTFDLGDYADGTDGLNAVSSFTLNVSDRFGDKTTFNASYNFINQENITQGRSRLSSTYIGNVINKNEDYVIENLDQSHRVKFGFDSKFDNNDLLKVEGNLGLIRKTILNTKDTELKNYEYKTKGVYQDSSQHLTPNGELEFLYSKHFPKKGRKLVGTLSLSSNQTKREEYVQEEYLESTLVNTNTNYNFKQKQFIDQSNYTNGSKASVSYVEPFFEHSLFEFTYEFDITKIDANRLVEDRLFPIGVRYIDSLTVDYSYYFRSNRTGVVYQFEPNKKFKMNVGFAVQPLTMKGSQFKDTVSYNYENINLIPTANFIFKLSKDMDWQISYRGKNNQPYFHQIAPIVDNSNSRNIIIGNPNLKAEFSNRISTALRKSIPSKMQYFETNFAYNYVGNKIVSDKKSVDNSTIQQTTFRNTAGYYDWKWYYMFNTPLITEDWQLDINGTTDFFNNLSFIDDRKRTTKQLIFNQSMQLKYNWSDYFESILNGNYVWSGVDYDIPYRTKINVETLFLGMGAKGYVNDNFSLGFEMSQRMNDGYKSSFMNVNQTTMNAFLEYTFLKNKSALVRFQGFDLFDQNKNMGIYSEYIGNDVYESKNNRLGRYFMLSLNLRLQKIPKSK